MALGLGGASFLALRGPEPPLNPRRVVVAPFENRTGDRALDPVSSMAADWIIQSLAGRGALEVVPITATLVSARYLAGDVPPAGTGYPSPATPPDAFSLARETGAGTAVSGSFYRQGDSIYFQARIDDVRTGSVLSGMEAIGSALDSPLEAIDRLRERVLVALVPLSDERDTHVRLAARPSYAAYQSYVRGFETFVHGDVRTALRHFQRAIAADSTFMMPAIASGIMHMNLADYAAADSAARRVDRNRDHLNPFEVATLDMLVGWLRGDDAHAYEASVRQARMAPGSIGEYQVAEQARRLNRPRETVAVLTAMGPERGELRGWFFYWRELTTAHHMLGDPRAELRAARRAREIYRATPAVLRQEVTALAALGDVNGVHSLIEERLSTRPAQAPTAGALMLLAARELAAHGHQPEAIPLFQRAIEWYRIQPSNETDAGGTGYGLGAALYHAHRWEEAQAVFIELAREAPRNLTFQGYLGVIAARLGNHEEAERIEAWLDDPAREYVFGNDALWRARILSLLGRHDQAMQQLRDAFARGVQHHPLHHLDIDLDPLREHPGFIELMRPKG